MHLMSQRDMIEQSEEHIRLSKEIFLEMSIGFWREFQQYYKTLYSPSWITWARQQEDRDWARYRGRKIPDTPHDIQARKNCVDKMTNVLKRLPKMFNEMLNTVQNFGIPVTEASSIASKTAQQKVLNNLIFFVGFLDDMFDTTEKAMDSEYKHAMDLLGKSDFVYKNQLYKTDDFQFWKKQIDDQQKRWMERVVEKRDAMIESVHGKKENNEKEQQVANEERGRQQLADRERGVRHGENYDKTVRKLDSEFRELDDKYKVFPT